jgi:hypothetical protein
VVVDAFKVTEGSALPFEVLRVFRIPMNPFDVE